MKTDLNISSRSSTVETTKAYAGAEGAVISIAKAHIATRNLLDSSQKPNIVQTLLSLEVLLH